MSHIVRTIIKTPKAPSAIGPYSQAVQVGQTLYLSGCLGADPATGALVSGGIEAETRQAFKNIGSILEAAGVGYGNVVKTTVLLADIQDFATLNSVYAEYFKSNHPARSTYQVAALPRGARVEIECIAVVGNIIEAPTSQL
jgi:2-iminobutanoate/2-iminopropanoate deaminase